MQQFQCIIILKTNDESFLSRFFHLKHSIQSLIADSSSTFKLFSRTSFSAIDQTINDNINFDSVESKQSKNVCAKITLNILNKREQIHATKKMSLNTTTFIQVNMYKKYTHRSTDQFILNRFELLFASLNFAYNDIY